jgi:hypothetical protein
MEGVQGTIVMRYGMNAGRHGTGRHYYGGKVRREGRGGRTRREVQNVRKVRNVREVREIHYGGRTRHLEVLGVAASLPHEEHRDGGGQRAEAQDEAEAHQDVLPYVCARDRSEEFQGQS